MRLTVDLTCNTGYASPSPPIFLRVLASVHTSTLYKLWTRLCFVTGSKHVMWCIIGHRFRYDSICRSHLNRVQGWAGARAGAAPVGIRALDSHGTGRWLRGRPSTAIQSAAIIHGGPTSCRQQVVSFITLALSRTNVSCLCPSCDVVYVGGGNSATSTRPSCSLHWGK